MEDEFVGVPFRFVPDAISPRERASIQQSLNETMPGYFLDTNSSLGSPEGIVCWVPKRDFTAPWATLAAHSVQIVAHAATICDSYTLPADQADIGDDLELYLLAVRPVREGDDANGVPPQSDEPLEEWLEQVHTFVLFSGSRNQVLGFA